MERKERMNENHQTSLITSDFLTKESEESIILNT